MDVGITAAVAIHGITLSSIARRNEMKHGKAWSGVVQQSVVCPNISFPAIPSCPIPSRSVVMILRVRTYMHAFDYGWADNVVGR